MYSFKWLLPREYKGYKLLKDLSSLSSHWLVRKIQVFHIAVRTRKFLRIL